MAITIHQESGESEGNDNGVEEILADNMPLHSEAKDEKNTKENTVRNLKTPSA